MADVARIHNGTLLGFDANMIWVNHLGFCHTYELEMAQKVIVDVLNNSKSTDIITTCDSLTWIDGTTYYSSNNNTVTHTLINPKPN